ncbi:MAG: gluconokinase [Verrucomicrobiales bacterium]|nr:gluconokinase [Verrucomicrobiales bacterium]
MSGVIIIMGVSGCGKSTLGEGLARKNGRIYIEGDELHPPANIAKMSSGQPLNDEDRWPWFDRIISETKKCLATHETVLVGCSALKEIYREYLFQNIDQPCRIIYLHGSFETIFERMQLREHFMPPELLKSQFSTLEEPKFAEDQCLRLPINQPVEDMMKRAEKWMNYRESS